MPEKYTGQASRVLFFACVEARRLGARVGEPKDLLFAWLGEDQDGDPLKKKGRPLRAAFLYSQLR